MKVVLTNGCFDLFHAGHVDFLWKAKDLGDWLIVAVNTDESVRKLKGAGRPINSLRNRIAVLASLKMIDLVVPLAATDMVEMILSVSPQIWCKGGDYTIKTLNKNEVKAARSVGAAVKIIPVTYDISTTKLLTRLHPA